VEEGGDGMVSKSRAIRIAERIRQDLSTILIMKSLDPRLAGLSVTDVTVDRELAFAEVYVCALDGVTNAEAYLGALEHAQGFLRSELAQRIQLRVFPKLRFHWDPTLEKAEVIEGILNTLHENEANAARETQEQPGKDDQDGSGQ
jgi:ribosome-binding factor A